MKWLKPMVRDPTFIGVVQDVHGSTVTVELSAQTVTGLSFVAGEGYRIGQVGSFVRIPLGFLDLYGVVSQVGAGAAPESDDENRIFGNRWLKVQLVGEGRRGGIFERGVSQHPTIDDRVHIVTEADLRSIYGTLELDEFVPIGHLASAASIPALVNINKLVTRHSAVVGSTGSGKSTTVAGLLNSLSNPTIYPSSRIVVLDIHGEYSKALAGRATVFKVDAGDHEDEKPLFIPYWALSFEELVPLVFGNINDTQITAIADAVVQLKKNSLTLHPRTGVARDDVTVDSPVPFSIHQLWFDFHKRENQTVIPKPGSATEEVLPAYVLDANENPVQLGDAMSVVPPSYRTIKTTGTASERVNYGKETLGIRQSIAGLASKLRDPKLGFLFQPGDWLPDADGMVSEDLDVLIQDWIGGENPITILNLAGVPSSVLNDLIGALLRILYDAIFWARNLPEGGRLRPLLLILEEAHTYLGRENSGSAAVSVRRIAKEGRKYGVGLMIVSQRPSEIDSTILSQCGTIFAMRLANDTDRSHVASAASDNLKGLFELLPILRTGEAIIVGEAVSLPIRTLISLPDSDKRPDSEDPKVAVQRYSGAHGFDGFGGPGGWNQARDKPNYKALVRQWRAQNSQYVHQPTEPSTIQPAESTTSEKREHGVD